jgi:hypothetical protein
VVVVVNLTQREADEIAGMLARVVPRGQDEADQLERVIRRLSVRPLVHGANLMQLYPLE